MRVFPPCYRVEPFVTSDASIVNSSHLSCGIQVFPVFLHTKTWKAWFCEMAALIGHPPAESCRDERTARCAYQGLSVSDCPVICAVAVAEGMKMSEFDLIIKNATICTMDLNGRTIDKGYVAIRENDIVRVEEGDVPENCGSAQTIDAAGQVLFPGFVDTHTHIFQSFLKGLGVDHRLIEWLNLSALPYGEYMTPYQHRLAAQLTCMEAIKSGCTTLCEFFYTDQNPELADGCIAGMEDTGIRSVFIRTFQDRGEDYGMRPA